MDWGDVSGYREMLRPTEISGHKFKVRLLITVFFFFFFLGSFSWVRWKAGSNSGWSFARQE